MYSIVNLIDLLLLHVMTLAFVSEAAMRKLVPHASRCLRHLATVRIATRNAAFQNVLHIVRPHREQLLCTYGQKQAPQRHIVRPHRRVPEHRMPNRALTTPQRRMRGG